MATLLAAFVVGELWFWFALVAISILLVIGTEKAETFWPTFGLIVFVGLVLWANHGWLLWVLAHPVTLVVCLAAYVALGVVWSFPKWYFFVKGRKQQVSEAEEYWRSHLEGHESWPSMTGYVEAMVGKSMTVAPMPADHKSRILGWMTYWVWSFAWTIINDPLRKVWLQAYYSLQGVYESMSRKIYAKHDNMI
jgi:hypothetical protein